MAVLPTTYGASQGSPRGDYSTAAADYTCEQYWTRYSNEEHSLFARLYQQQSQQIKNRACDEYVQGLKALDIAGQIPRFEQISVQLIKATRWQLVAVPGLIPEQAFFSLLSQRRFPITVWLRRADEFDYIVEPDVFHDLFGHVPLLFNPVFADYMQAFGLGGLKAQGLQALQFLARLYWYTVEFGLIKTDGGMRAYGAGVLSSSAELVYALTSNKPSRIAFDLEQVLRTPYKIDDYQQRYFVIKDFQQLFDATEPDFTSIYQRLSHIPDLSLNYLEASAQIYPPNSD